jgi:hypothetical protein
MGILSLAVLSFPTIYTIKKQKKENQNIIEARKSFFAQKDQTQIDITCSRV